MGHYIRQVMRFIETMDTQEWILVLFGVVIVGLVCLRGFGSRSKY